MGPFSGSAPLREDVHELGLSSESHKTRDCDYAEVTRIMHLHNDCAKFRHSDYAKFRQTVVPLRSTVHLTVKAAADQTGAYFLTQIRNRRAWGMVVATMKIQLLERAVPPSAGIFGIEQAGARRVMLNVAAASWQPLGLVRRVDLAGSRVGWRLRMT